MATPGPSTPSSSTPSSQSQQIPYTVQREMSAPAGFSGMMQQSPAPAPQMMSPTKDINIVNMCRAGQELVHDIVSRAQEVFSLLSPKYMQLPNNVTFSGQQYAERKAKVDEQLRQITLNFRKLRVFYSKVNETCDQMEMPSDQELIPYVGKEVERTLPYSDVYHYVVEQHRDMVEQVRLKNQQLIPYVGKEVERTLPYSDVYHYVVEQHRDMVEQVRLKNQQLKEVIDSMRSIIWEINTMITMRKT